MSKLAQIHTYPPSLAKSKIMVKTFSLYHTGPVTCNSYFRHFETDSEKKNHYNSILFPERKKKRLQMANIILFILSRLSGFSFFPTIPDYFESFLGYRKCPESASWGEIQKFSPLFSLWRIYFWRCMNA